MNRFDFSSLRNLREPLRLCGEIGLRRAPLAVVSSLCLIQPSGAQNANIKPNETGFRGVSDDPYHFIVAGGGMRKLVAPDYKDDIALRIKR
jgi:hypothetical protein